MNISEDDLQELKQAEIAVRLEEGVDTVVKGVLVAFHADLAGKVTAAVEIPLMLNQLPENVAKAMLLVAVTKLADERHARHCCQCTQEPCPGGMYGGVH